ncbi:MAG: DUF447 family protein [Candidatus Jordarchaeales archaeon]|nr:DUF447 family protein [Candidatus Jordarchaeia archaeon]
MKLDELGFEAECIYEVIITTLNEDGTLNAAPMGILSKDLTSLVVRPYVTTRTYHNIARTREAVVNVTDDITLFYITIFEKERVKEMPSMRAKRVSVPILAKSKAYVECVVEEEPVICDGRADIKMRAVECGVLDRSFRPICRAPNLILESIIHFTRIEPLIRNGEISKALKLLELIAFYRDIVQRVCNATRYEEIVNKIYEEACRIVKEKGGR